MTEHAAVIFVFFFLAEYASIVLICVLTSILFLGGYLINIKPILYVYFLFDILSVYLVNILDFYYSYILFYLTGDFNNFSFPSISLYDYFNGNYVEYFIMSLAQEKKSLISNLFYEGIYCGLILGFKSCLMIFIFI
jgi:NADH-ubiquinone oxidoreductase chain 1